MSELGNATELGPKGQSALEPTSIVTFVAAAATTALTASGTVAFNMDIIANSAWTITGMTEYQVINLFVFHTDADGGLTAGPWTLSANGTALTLNSVAGGREYVTGKFDDATFAIDNAAAVNAGSGEVTIPITGHKFIAGHPITLSGTTNYDGTYTIQSIVAGVSVNILATYQAEVFAGTEGAKSFALQFQEGVPVDVTA